MKYAIIVTNTEVRHQSIYLSVFWKKGGKIMQHVGVLFCWIFLLSVAGATDKNSLPSGEPVDCFLIRQVRGGFAELTTDTQKKKPLQLFLEELVLADGRDKAPGKWLDDLPDTAPTAPPDIAPRLTSATLYHDVATANAHWDAFLKRYYLTGNYLKEHVGRPNLSSLPGEEFEVWLSKLLDRHVDEEYKDATDFSKTMSESLLYADFLFARGDNADKIKAYRILLVVTRSMLYNEFRDKTLTKYMAKEILWPMVNPSAGRFSPELGTALGGIFFDSKEDYYRLQKWMVSYTQMNANAKEGALLMRGNAYVDTGDYLGAIVCNMAATPSGEWGNERTDTIRTLLKNKYGAEKGAAYYKRFQESIMPGKQTMPPNDREGKKQN